MHNPDRGADVPEEPLDRIRLRRDAQQWEFDRAIRDTGRVYHWQPPGPGRLPDSVRMHRMIAKHLGQQARKVEAIARAEAAAGHDVTALEFFFDAATTYGHAQHTIFVNNAEKRMLHEASIRCYDEVRARAPRPIEHIDVPWDGTVVSGNLHLADVDGPAPLVFFIPGCDMTKEMAPHPLYSWGNQRGMHVFAFDGPGQGESNLRGIKVTQTNYEEAASAALDHLLARDDVDAARVGLHAMSFGSYWGARFAATDDRITATTLMWASICDKYYLFEEESPRYKQLFSYLTGAKSEEELDAFIAGMGLEQLLPDIACPTLLTVGEYDPRSPVEEVFGLYDSMHAPRELWVYADQHHMANVRGGKAGGTPAWALDTHSVAMDWLADRFAGVPLRDEGQVRYLQAAAPDPYDERVEVKRRWFE